MKRLLLALLLLVLALPAQAADPVKLGAFFALSGPAAPIGTPTKLVAEMAVDQLNKRGGVLGREVELVTGDTEGEATRAVMVLKKFLALQKVDAVIGPTRTGTGMAVKKQIETAKVPTIMTVGGDPVIMTGKIGDMDFGTAEYVFKAPQRSSTAVEKVLTFLKQRGLTKIAVLTASDGFGRDGARWLGKLAPAMGFEIVGQEQFNPTDVDMKTQLTKLAASDPQAIVCWTIGPAGSIVSKNHHALGMSAPLVQCHGLPDPGYLDLAGPAAEGDLMPATKLMTYESLPDDDPQKAVIAEFVRLYEDEYDYDEKFPINTHSGYAWDAVMLLAQAMERAGSTESAAVKAALESTEGHVGVSGVYTITPEDHVGLGLDSMVMLQVVDGAFRMVD